MSTSRVEEVEVDSRQHLATTPHAQRLNVVTQHCTLTLLDYIVTEQAANLMQQILGTPW